MTDIELKDEKFTEEELKNLPLMCSCGYPVKMHTKEEYQTHVDKQKALEEEWKKRGDLTD